ncbi:MAG: ABC transporter substrate-binding protein [Rickettsiales bacterium]|nr:ABC transporter substrate-binding protein [Rickettsiales bacterium]
MAASRTSIADEGGISNFINDFLAKFEKIDRIGSTVEKEDMAFELANNTFDLDWMGNFILGKYRKELSEEKKRDFIINYSKSLVKNYIPILGVYKKDNYKILSVEPQAKDNVYNVATIVKIDGKDVKNDFRIVKKDNDYYVTDIIVEGVSFISAQRTEINSIISSGNFDEFMRNLQMENSGND